MRETNVTSKWRPLWWAVAASTVLAFSAACSGGAAKTEGQEAKSVILSKENVTFVRSERLEVGPRLAGTLQPRSQAAMRAEVGGVVTEVRVDLGEIVKAGQILGRIESSTLKDAYASAEASLRSAQSSGEVAKKEMGRAERLVEGGALAERDLETARSANTQAEAQVSEARSRLASARKMLSDATFRAPFDGVVSQKGVNTGDTVAPGATLFTVIDPSSMRIEASFPSDALSVLKSGAPVEFSVRGYPNRTFRGQVDRIAPAADPITRQIPVLVAIPNPGGELVAGLFAEGKVAAESRDAKIVPLASVEDVGGESRVRRVKDNKVEFVRVEVGVRDERSERAEILSGLEVGDLVLAGSARDLAAGTRIELRDMEKDKDAGTAARAETPGQGGSGASKNEAAAPAAQDTKQQQ